MDNYSYTRCFLYRLTAARARGVRFRHAPQVPPTTRSNSARRRQNAPKRGRRWPRSISDREARIPLEAARLVLAQAHNAQRDQTLHRRVENLRDAATLRDDPTWRPR